MNLADYRTNLQFLIGFNNGQTNQDFNGNLQLDGTVVTQIDWLINQAGQRELELSQANGETHWFKQHKQDTWPAGQLTYVPTIDPTKNQIIRFIDETNGIPGYEFIVAGSQDWGGIFWLDRTTLQWGTVGPGANVLVGIEYIPGWTNLVNATDTPTYFPVQHHQVILWSAAVLARELADEVAPQAWYKNLQDRRESLWTYQSSAQPRYGNFHVSEGSDTF